LCEWGIEYENAHEIASS